MANRRGKFFVFFADLKAAFDKVDRLQLGEMLEKAGINDQLKKKNHKNLQRNKELN